MIFQIFKADWAQTFSSVEGIVGFLISYLIFLILMAIFLKLALNLFSKAKHKEFGQVSVTALILTIVFALTFLFLGSWLAWVIVLVVTWLIINGRHNTGFLGAIVVTILAFILFIIVIILLVVLFGFTLFVILF